MYDPDHGFSIVETTGDDIFGRRHARPSTAAPEVRGFKFCVWCLRWQRAKNTICTYCGKAT